ncbi:MAG: 3-hydroxyacyl-CoA dehydrogenase/enoyl-CoA hydratase family protein [Syntrophobacterales bacterium]|nr:MAG: 3-hydroxyacyl-CoA dehydrogenase/enoyl-CoA hydratase family protein [Syntrophobacterales bacterium]
MASDLYPTYYNPLIEKPERPMPNEVAMVGAGTIGPDIGYYLKSALPEMKLYLVDIVEKPLEDAKKRIEGYIQKAIEKKKMTEEKSKAVGRDIHYTMDYGEIKGADLVIEAATENLEIKRKIFAQVEEIVSPGTIITSNTSSIPAERIFSGVKRPERTTITHFFAPAWRNPAVEVITWKKVDRKIVDYLAWMFCATGKTPIISKSEICFILDRVFCNWCNDAAMLLDTATASQVDKVAEEFVFAGPFYVLNLTKGNPINVEASTLQMEEGQHYRPAKIFQSVESWVTAPTGSKVDVPDDIRERVSERLLGVLFSQSFDIINRGIGTLEDLNLGCQIGLGFRKGPFDIMRDLREGETRRIIDQFQKDHPGMPGPKGEVSAYLDFKRHILVDQMNGVRIITIRRPQFLNALNEEVNDEIWEVLKDGENDPTVMGFVITGYGGRAFCAGAEIGKFSQLLGDAEASIQYSRDCSKLLRFIDGAEKPVVAAVNGMTLGGGAELAMRCHRLVATRNAYFQFPEVTLGILPGIGGMVVPYRRWPASAQVFHDMIRFGTRLSAERAMEIGVVDRLVDNYAHLIASAVQEVKDLGVHVEHIHDGPVEIAGMESVEPPMAGKLLLSREVVGIISKAIEDAARATTFEEALDVGYKAFGQVACTEAAKEGISAFLEKRSPEFRK